MKRRHIPFVALILLFLLLGLTFFWLKNKKTEPVPVPITPEAPMSAVEPSTAPEIVVPPPFAEKPQPIPPVKKQPVVVQAKKAAPSIKPPPPVAPPPKVEIHEELIPKNIEIVRFYYQPPFTGPGVDMPFDINGSGFNTEFEKMIKVDPNHVNVKVKKLKLLTPNQIHGTFIVDKKTPTGVIYPRVLIQDKVVFQAPDPFAVIRPGEVLGINFIDMGESGRSGRFRIYTNLTESQYKKFSVRSSTPVISISDMRSELPFMVEGTVNIGQAPMGSYDFDLVLDGKIIYHRPGLIRIIKPDVGQSGHVQRIIPREQFYRPGDTAWFAIQGSGFQPKDVTVLQAKVDGLENLKSTFTFVAPGRMELMVSIPSTAPVAPYSLKIYQGDKELLKLMDAFVVIDQNFIKRIFVDPPLTPGGSSKLILDGRDMADSFVTAIKINVDDKELKVGSFKLESKNKASAEISAGLKVAPGDYWIRMSDAKGPVEPFFGSIIQVSAKK